MPFSIFTSVNNYSQSVCFAEIIMYNKITKSFLWAFTSFLKMVNNHPLKVFLIDEDQAIIKAVDLIFISYRTKHILYLWHLLKNVIKNLNKVLESSWVEFIKHFY